MVTLYLADRTPWVDHLYPPAGTSNSRTRFQGKTMVRDVRRLRSITIGDQQCNVIDPNIDVRLTLHFCFTTHVFLFADCVVGICSNKNSIDVKYKLCVFMYYYFDIHILIFVYYVDGLGS
jgi:hypothetical protein